jgi:hypothetical protein
MIRIRRGQILGYAALAVISEGDVRGADHMAATVGEPKLE